MPKFNKKLILESDTHIHCDTENKAIALMKWAHSENIQWRSGDLVLKKSKWDFHKERTCYDIDPHSLGYGDKGAVKLNSNNTVLSYEEVIIKEKNAKV